MDIGVLVSIFRLKTFRIDSNGKILILKIKIISVVRMTPNSLAPTAPLTTTAYHQY